MWDCSACSGLRLLLTISDGTLKLLTHICWHFQVPGPHCETWASCLLDDDSLTCYLSNIKSILLIVFFFFSLCQGVKDSFLLLPSGFHCFTVLPGVLSFENSKYVFLFIITEDSGTHCSFRFQAANCRVSPYFSLSHFDYIAYSELQMWCAFFLSVMYLF